MSQLSEIATLISAIALAGSLSSFVGSAFILICYAILPLDYHFRHVLIINLSIADFFNGLVNSVGGIYILSRKRTLEPGPPCIIQGLIGQITVQGTDCAILAMAITTICVITETWKTPSIHGESRYRYMILTSCAIWALPLTTGYLALIKGWYAPATGNWCWLVDRPAYLRYVLTHAWRILFITTEICLYTFMHIRIRQHFQRMAESLRSVDVLPAGASDFALHNESGSRGLYEQQCTGASSSGLVDISLGSVNTVPAGAPDSPSPASILSNGGDETGRRDLYEPHGTSSGLLDKTGAGASPRSNLAADPRSGWSLAKLTGFRGTQRASSPLTNNPQYQQYRAIRKMLFLNVYPFAYIILWIPGIVNRLIEASGHTSTAAQVMQSSTQLVGLANALTYGWNEQIAVRVRKRFRKRTVVV